MTSKNWFFSGLKEDTKRSSKRNIFVLWRRSLSVRNYCKKNEEKLWGINTWD